MDKKLLSTQPLTLLTINHHFTSPYKKINSHFKINIPMNSCFSSVTVTIVYIYSSKGLRIIRVQRKSFLQLVFQASIYQRKCHFNQPQKLLTSRIDSTVVRQFEFLKQHHSPIGQVRNIIHQPKSKIHQPWGYWTLLSLHIDDVANVDIL